MRSLISALELQATTATSCVEISDCEEAAMELSSEEDKVPTDLTDLRTKWVGCWRTKYDEISYDEMMKKEIRSSTDTRSHYI